MKKQTTFASVLENATPNGIRNTLIQEHQKRGEVAALMNLYVSDFAEERGYDSVIEMYTDETLFALNGQDVAAGGKRAMDTCRLELYAPFKVDGFQEEGNIAKTLYDCIAKRWSRYMAGLKKMVAAMEPVVEETAAPSIEPIASVVEIETTGDSKSNNISETEDRLYASMVDSVRGVVTSYLLETELTSDVNVVINNMIAELKGWKAELAS